MQPEPSSSRQYVELATLAQRFQAAILDKIVFPTIMLVPFILGFDLLNLSGGIDENFTISFATQVKVSLLEILLFMALNSYLLKEYGQTLGKRIVGIAVVDENGLRLSLQDIILKRYLPFWVAAYLPFFGFVITISNFLAIFRGDQRRCLHDDLAKTVVVKMPRGRKITSSETHIDSDSKSAASDVMDA
ncbi:RDD family protein [Moritella yayanosii]|uniref:RDD domain-containing protein n=1 Tax=Moritella yayanosii TaxID=69539 RepID=A0A330LV31_9GAMM|nr:RDD family protein [Moritella yayanosii]SQD79881.1 conserved protein of unknown function [Moritella yayanosii]